MKNRFFFIVIFILTYGFHGYSQHIKGSILAGFNATQVDGDRVYGFHKYGWNAGASAITPLWKNFSIVLEAIYNQKGSNQKARSYDSIDGSYKLILNYLDVPIYLNYFDPKGKMNFGTGVAFGRLVEFKEWMYGNEQLYPAENIPYKNTSIDWFFNVYFSLYKGLKFNMRYSYSIQSIRHKIFTDGAHMSQYHNMISMRLMFVFNDGKGKRKKKTPSTP